MIFTGTTYGLIKFYIVKTFFEIYKCCLGVILTSIKYCRVQTEPSYIYASFFYPLPACVKCH